MNEPIHKNIVAIWIVSLAYLYVNPWKVSTFSVCLLVFMVLWVGVASLCQWLIDMQQCCPGKDEVLSIDEKIDNLKRDVESLQAHHCP